MKSLIEKLKGRLIVSCQALPGNALRPSSCISAMAEAAMLGGAGAIRANGVEDILAIVRRVSIPVIGINKTAIDPDYPYITPDFEHAQEIAALGIDMIAIDATLRPRRDGKSPSELIYRIKNELHLPVMADIATLEEGIAAAAAGADVVATTMSGYTAGRKRTEGPDIELVRELCAHIQCPVIAEGRYISSEDADNGFSAGAHAVVIGKAITNPEFITRRIISSSRYLNRGTM